ncbi:DUF2568 domain-containing protein [Micromonospora sp. CPCC 205556]|uniref:DUF2568 domain-containing protein n=1 Tax=Micromonospora sp. CPCC 205556 TaxID=3122398 RepID=UPI002FF1B001
MLAGLGAPLLIGAVWGTCCSPKARVPLTPGREVRRAGGLLLALAGHPLLALGLVVVWAVDRTMLTRASHPA